jgi:hypothetical protein
MPECRGCGVALAPHELVWCRECWDATENDEIDLSSAFTDEMGKTL